MCIRDSVNSEPPLIYIDEGDNSGPPNKKFGDGDPPAFDPLNARNQIVVTNLPIIEWKANEAADLLVTCTETNFKIHLNGQFLKSINYWHDSSDADEPVPTITRLGWKTVNNAVISKVSWTYGKISRLKKNFYFYCNVIHYFVNILKKSRSLVSFSKTIMF